MSRAEKKLSKLKATEELNRLKRDKKERQRQELANTPTGVKVVSAVIVGVVFLFIFIGILSGGASDKSSTTASEEGEVLVSKVAEALDEMDSDFKSTLASTGPGGLQGEIIGVESDGKDGVVVKVSTHFQEPGDSLNGGQVIAQNIFSNICYGIPELKTLYVTSTTSGLDSRSVYQSSVPACSQ